ncbi:MAG: PAT family beta-lactamase induction signal transducer AmpG [Gammaproteobacteria bacterium]|jgi:PAT family beta-lactamase induction signal transducer AmpG
MINISETLKALSNRRMGVMLMLGFSSGLPLALSGGTLQAWLATTTIDIKTIGIFSLVGLPYTLKFLWAPIMDRFVPPFFGRRRGWILLTQGLLFGLILAMASSHPEDAIFMVGFIAVAVAFCSASQDIAIDAYRADVLKPEERGFGSALSVAGYRIAMLVSGSLALVFADYLGWQLTYYIMGGLILIGMATTIFGPELTWQVEAPKSLQDAIVEPFKEFMSRPNFLWILVLIILYKLGDAFAGTLTTTFLLRGLEFSLTEVGVVNKGMGLFASIAGGLVGGGLMFKYGLYRCLLWFGILQALTNLGFMILALMAKNYIGMVIVIAMEQIAGGMGTATFVALLITLCDHRFTATQFALFSALSAVGRVFIGPPAGLLVDSLGWTSFFLITFVVALPGLALLIYLRKSIESYHSILNSE